MADRRTSSGKLRRWHVRIPIELHCAEGEFNGEKVYGMPSSLGLAVTAKTAHEACERVLDALQKAVDDV